MSFYGPLTIGRLTLTEDFNVKETGGSRTLQVQGQESWPPLVDADEVRYRGEQLMAMEGQLVPVQFSSKSDRDGFYIVDKPQVSYTHHDGMVSVCDWQVSLIWQGGESEAWFESRLVGGTRTSYAEINYERWHSPAGSHVGYFAGTEVPSSMVRTGAQGSVTVYRNLNEASSPRWGSTVANYSRGAAGVSVDGLIRTGLTCPNSPNSWSLHNSLIQVTPATFPYVFTVARYLAGGYSDTYDDSYGTGDYADGLGITVLVDGVYPGTAKSISILRNTFDECVVRTTYQHQRGYSTVDFSLKRGAHFVSVIAQHQESVAFTVYNGVSGTDPGAGYVLSSADANGDRYLIGSAERLNVNAPQSMIENAIPGLSFACFVGVEVGGAGAIDGNNAYAVALQYLGTPSEVVKAINR